MSDWTPPHKLQHGYDFGDWRPIRDAIEAAYGALGRDKPRDIPKAEWELVGLALSYRDHMARPNCVECKRKLQQYEIIRCLDCKAPLCELCAPRHFWPNGRMRGAPPHEHQDYSEGR